MNDYDLEQDAKIKKLEKKLGELEHEKEIDAVKSQADKDALNKDIKFVRDSLAKHKIVDAKHKKDREEYENKEFKKLDNKATYNAILLTIITGAIMLVAAYGVSRWMDSVFQKEPIIIKDNNNSKVKQWQ